VEGLRVDQENCAMNYFSTGAADDCQTCDGGHSDPGSSSCVDTAPGHFYDGTTDQQCVAGKFSASGAAEESGCVECSSGKFSAAAAAYCNTAGAGKMISKVLGLRVGLEDCGANTFSTGANDVCEVCDEGSHSEPGSTSCAETPPGHF